MGENLDEFENYVKNDPYGIFHLIRSNNIAALITDEDSKTRAQI